MRRPVLRIMIGIPGSGKTTFCKEHVAVNPEAVHISSDKIREELWGDAAVQGDNHQVFALMHQRVLEALNNGHDVLYDATNVTRKDRASIISICPAFAKVEAHIVWAPIEECIKRDAVRERSVGKAVIDKFLKRFQAPFWDEKFTDIHIHLPHDFDIGEYDYKSTLAMDIPHDNPHHTVDILPHCNLAGKYAMTHQFGYHVTEAALLHDLGKPYCKAFVDSKGEPCEVAHFYNHQNVSAYLYYGMHNASPEVAWLISTHMDPYLNTKYYQKLPKFLKDQVDKLHEADMAAH